MLEHLQHGLSITWQLMAGFGSFVYDMWQQDAAIGKVFAVLSVVAAALVVLMILSMIKDMTDWLRNYLNFRDAPIVMVDGLILKRRREYIPPSFTPITTFVGSVALTNVVSSGGYTTYQMLVQADGTQLWCYIDDGDYENAKRDQPVRVGVQTGHDGTKRIKTYQFM